MEPVHVGWLIKSPPEKRIWRAKWRRRWFVLRQSGQIPGQYLLEYYTDTSCKKLKGKIDLDQCNQVDAGLTFESRKWNYQFMFDIRTPKRIYLLVAETEAEMNKWVDYICSVCGLKIDAEEDQPADDSSVKLPVVTQPSNAINVIIRSNEEIVINDDGDSPTGPYIPISECVTGKSSDLNGNSGFLGMVLDQVPPLPKHKFTSRHRRMSGEVYDYPRQIHPLGLDRSSPDLNLEDMYKVAPISSVSSNDAVFEDEWSPTPKVNWETYPGDSTVRESLVRVQISKSAKTRKPSSEIYENVRKESTSDNETEKSIPPRRPPKPPHLIDTTNYQNMSNKVVPAPNEILTNSCAYDIPNSDKAMTLPKAYRNRCLDEMYDFPRPLQDDNLNVKPPPPSNSMTHPRKHAYSNAPAGYLQDNVFTYDSRILARESYLNMELRMSRESDVYTDMTGEVHPPSPVYTNLPSPANALPPVNRELKPRRTVSDKGVSRSCSSASSTDMSGKSPSPVESVMPPPSVNRELKPRWNTDEGNKESLNLAPPPACRIKPSNTKRSFRRPRPSPSPTSSTSSRNRVILPNNAKATSSSDDDQSSSGGSRRNSANEEPHDPYAFNFLSMTNKRDAEIQYLDLDLESDLLVTPKSPERASTSTVYKTVDFIKTKAFNETRQNVEETYRKSQN